MIRLCLMMIAWLSLNSCRQDILQEQETYNNTSAFQLTSKRISLNESKHKAQLLPELKKAENGIEALSKTEVSGKIINYGNGVSIDTDDVVFIEYGPYHTYTFKINRENATADGPVENLILSLEPDGTYKELVKTYNLTQNDWHELSLGNGIDLEGKTTTVEVAKGTYYQANAKGSGCSYQSQQVYQACCHGVHGEGNIGEWGNCTCTGNGLPKMYTIEILVCPPEPGAPTSGWVPTPSSPTAPTAGGEPLDGGNSSGSETNPTDPNTVEGAQGQLGGTPTLPILGGGPNDPCEKLKNNLQKAKDIIEQTDVKNKNDIMKANIMSDVFEKAFYWGKDSSGTLKTSNIVDGTVGNVTFGISGSQFAPEAYIHNHNGTGGYMNFSSTDIYAFHTFSSAFSTLKHNYANGSDGSQYVMTLENKTEFNAFVTAYPISTVDVSTNTYEGTGDWNLGTAIRTDEENLLQYFRKQGKTENEAMDLAMGYLIKKYNMGIMISKKGTDGKFYPIQVEGVEITNPVTGEKEMTYNPINPCNL